MTMDALTVRNIGAVAVTIEGGMFQRLQSIASRHGGVVTVIPLRKHVSA